MAVSIDGDGGDPASPEPESPDPPAFASPGGRPPPRTARGVRTRAALVAAARSVFERKGFLDARLLDITREAQCSAGSFYTYFDSKEEILAAVLGEAQEEMLHPGTERVAADDDPAAVVAASNRAYFEAYRRNARLMALLEQVAQIDPEIADLRRRRAAAFVERNARSIADLQRAGRADAEVDPMLASEALSAMVSRLAYGHFVGRSAGAASLPGPGDAEFEALVFTATRLWVNALGLDGARP
ncbi:TetR/AcrR family transcriptional regulator [Rhodococcus rhodnii]|uniref:TetR/AcrR family transcriptional regulator n=1 Tax=Rhodococcus rhodnii TaxID=38312 RepID=A0A6P2CDY8_9NOCA|nr:TetR/AcrR family transcriptional regulator [Rhodococcus rhodnii]TXG89921.1 TetR/AcrR family transcriptional regulator [Rhodococcus rhodnii]